ncbi:unnamed protein product [Cuscuta campestris]|uniref:Uncharacterized protein n=1 Tax=Cuscuta campestris TaxID=132261 RepID=A0A484MUW6_9ASTE|nr:unnamed protein product [Cuscuta campestris]
MHTRRLIHKKCKPFLAMFVTALMIPMLEIVEMVNEFVISLIPEYEMVCLSFDSSCQADSDVVVDDAWITVEF